MMIHNTYHGIPPCPIPLQSAAVSNLSWTQYLYIFLNFLPLSAKAATNMVAGLSMSGQKEHYVRGGDIVF